MSRVDEVHLFENCTLVHTPTLEDGFQISKNTSIAVDVASGKILKISQNSSQLNDWLNQTFPNSKINRTTLSPNQLLIPGFIDTHAHAPQYIFSGNGLDLPLLEWLKKYTFPAESKYEDCEHAKKIYQLAINRMIKNGTTTVSIYGTLHTPASNVLANLLAESGMRSFVGKVCMDCNAPDWYVEPSADESLRETQKFVDHVKSLNSSLTHPIITPRFAPTCSPDLLQGLGEIAEKQNLLVQTHLSENKDEIEWVKSLFPNCSSYTDVYLKYGLLRQNTILAHCIYLSDEELELIRRSKSSISHCPLSNVCLQSGSMDVKKYLDMKIPVGLGTDFAGGFSSNMLTAIREAVHTSKQLCLESRLPFLTLAQSFYLATQGGAQALGLNQQIGSFEEGKYFDAQLIDCCSSGPFDVFGGETELELLEKFLYLGDDRNVLHVWVNGKLIK